MEKSTIGFDQHLSHEFDIDEPEVMDALESSLPWIGLVVVSFNRLENLLDQAICEAFSDRSDSVGLLVIHSMQFGAKVELYRRLSDDLHMLIGRQAVTYEGLIDDLKKAANLRNLVVHANWGSTDAEGFTFTKVKVTSRGMVQEYHQLTQDSLLEVSRSIDVTRSQLDLYIEERMAVIHDR